MCACARHAGQLSKLLDMLPEAVDQCALAALPHKLVLQSFSATPPENNTRECGWGTP